MSGLRERLLRHKKTEPAASTAAAPPVAHDEQDEQWALIGAAMAYNEKGAFVLRKRSYSDDFMHGRYALGQLAGQSDSLMSILLPGDVEAANGGLPYEQLLFLDTETTGLGIGAGNVPFMIGIGFYEAGQFIVEQMFIRNPAEELAMLHHLQHRLDCHPYLVSYNGKTFDWPIIKNRYVLNRMPSEPYIAGHLDFLYPSRSLWKHTLPSCRLGKVEEERLHVTRQEDVPGSLAPTLYFQYLAEKDIRIVQGVFDHNELDLLSLAGLSIHFSRVLAGRYQLAEMELEEQFRLGLWFHKLQLASYAEAVLEQLKARLLLQDASAETGDEHLLPLAQVYKQQRRYDDACELWLSYVERKGRRSTASVEPYVELSMHYEHREKRLTLALHYAEQALDKARQRKALIRPGRQADRARGRGQTAAAERSDRIDTAELEKRLDRLRQKMKRESERFSVSEPSAGTGAKPARKRGRAADGSGYFMDSLI